MSLKNTLCSFFTVFITVCVLAAVLIITYGFHDNIRAADVGVILGNHVHRNGTPSKRLTARLNKGIELYQAGLIQNIIVSGGINRHGIGEGSAMKNYLINHRVRPSAIFVDNRGANTWRTAVNTKAIMQKNDFSSVIAISQYYHLARTVFAFHRCGITTVYHAHAPYFEWRDFYSVPREVLAICYYFLFHHYG